MFLLHFVQKEKVEANNCNNVSAGVLQVLKFDLHMDRLHNFIQITLTSDNKSIT